ncbi:glycosyltransferase [Arthrobacter sp. MMS24-S77]
MSPRILIVLKTSQGGMWIIPHITALLERGFGVTVILPGGRGRLRSALETMQVDLVDSEFNFSFRPSLRTLWGLARLRRKIREIAPAAVLYHLYASALAVRIATLWLKVPKVHMVAGPLYLESSLIRFLERFLVKADTVVIGGSTHTSDLYRELGVSEAELRTIPYGVDTKKFIVGSAVERSECRGKLGIPPHHFVVIMVAYVYAPKSLVHPGLGIKGHETLLAAWSRFHDVSPDSTLLLVGAGFDEEGEIHRKRLLQTIDVAGNDIIWVDTVQDVQSMYWSADVSVSPSISENHGAALEAGACGIPSIVSDAGGLPETVTDETGWIFARGDEQELFDALCQANAAFTDGSLPLRSGGTREFMVQRFDCTTLASRVADVVGDLVAEVDPGRGAKEDRWATYFCESRFGRDLNGYIAAIDEASSANLWDPYVQNIRQFRLAGRVNTARNSAERSLEGIPIYPLPYYVGFRGFVRSLPKTAIAVFRAISSSRRVIARLPGAIGFMAVVFARFMGRRVFVEVVGDPREVLLASNTAVLRRLAGPVGLLMRWCVGQAEAGRFVTQNYLQERYPLQESAVRIAISDVRLVERDFSAHYSRSSEFKWRLGAVGSQERDYKGHDLAIRALSELRKDGLDADLTLVGKGVEQASLRLLATELDVQEHVTFVDAIHSRQDLNEFMDCLDILLHPSRTEGLPRVVLEAMARSRPVIGSDVGGVPELVDPRWIVGKGDVESLVKKIGEMMKLPDNELHEIASRNFATASFYRHDLLNGDFLKFLRIVDND